MEKLYTFSSKQYIAQLQSDICYNWFVYNRCEPVQPYETVIQGYGETQYAQIALDTNRPTATNIKSRIYQTARKTVDSLFTAHELQELQKFLAVFMPNMVYIVEEIETPITLAQAVEFLCPDLAEASDCVDPADLCDCPEFNLNFQVSATISYQPHFVADDFLSNLSPARLEMLRVQHTEQNG